MVSLLIFQHFVFCMHVLMRLYFLWALYYISYELYLSLSSKRRPFDIRVSVPLGHTSITGWVRVEWTWDIAPKWCSWVERAGLYNWTVPGYESALAPASLSRLLNHPEPYSPLAHGEITGPTSEGCHPNATGHGMWNMQLNACHEWALNFHFLLIFSQSQCVASFDLLKRARNLYVL